jgi:hypothetical protein
MSNTWLLYRRRRRRRRSWRRRRRRSIQKGVNECLLKASLATFTLIHYISSPDQVAVNCVDIKNIVP